MKFVQFALVTLVALFLVSPAVGQVFEVSSGVSCSADWETPTNTTALIMTCSIDDGEIFNGRMSLTSKVGLTRGIVVSFHYEQVQVTVMLVRRSGTPDNMLSIEVAINSEMRYSETVTIP